MMKRPRGRISSTFFVLLLLTCALFAFVTGTASAAQDGDYTYTENGGLATITGYTGPGGAITIPSSLDGYIVGAIGDSAFYQLTSLTSVVIPDGVTTLGDSAFWACTNLTSVTIPDSVTNIGDFTFAVCSSLTSLTIPGCVTEIGAFAFETCTSLTSVTIPDSVTTIGEGAFWACTSLTSVTIGGGVTSIPEGTFAYCFALTSVNISYSLTSIGRRGFFGCTSLSNLTIPDSVTAIGDYSFDYCVNLTSVTIPDSTTTIGNRSFDNCTSLTSVSIGSGVSSIGNYAFASCANLTSVTFLGLAPPITVGPYWIEGTNDGIRGHAYADSNFPDPGGAWNGLKMGAVISEDYTYTVSGGVATITGYTGAGGAIIIPSTLGGYPTAAIGFMAFSNKGSLTSIIIPSGVTSIGGWAFVSCASLVTVSMPDGLVSIGDSAFAYCSALTSLSFPNSVSSIGEGAFFGAASLTSVNMPSNLTTIGQYAFASTSLSSLTIPANVTSIGDQAFNALTTLAAIDVSVDNAFYCSVDGVLYDKNVTTLIQCAGGKVGGLIIPDSVTSIGDYAFNGCDSLSSVAIPDSVASIGMTAFRYCDSMTSVNIPRGVTTIKDSTFQQCSSLTCIVIPDSVTSIEYNAFGGCGSLTTVTLGRGVMSIGNGVFFDCTSLTSIIFLGLVAPTTVGTDWILNAFWAIGHASAASNFPTPGNDFYGLTMGSVILTVPSAPTNLTAAEGITHVVLTWSPPNDDGGSAITNYRVYRSDNGAMSYSLIASAPNLTYTDTNLTKGHTYQYKASAVNALGEGENCSAINATIPNTDFTRHYSGKGYSILVPAHWTAQDDVNMSGVTVDTVILGPSSYGVQTNAIVMTGIDASIVDTKEYLNQLVLVAVSGLVLAGATNLTMTASPQYVKISNNSAVVFDVDFSLNGFDIHQKAAFIIDAEHSVYWTITCTESQTARSLFDPTFGVMINEFVVSPMPDVPQDLRASAGDAQVTLEWKEPFNHGTSAITNYRVYRSATEGGPYILVASPLDLAFNDTGLTNGQTYWYKVSAVNTVGEGWMTSSILSTPFTIPSAPVGLTVIAGNTQVSLNWTAPYNDGGSSIIDYNVYRSSTETGNYLLIASLSRLTYNDTNLTNGQTYYYAVSAVNSAGESLLTEEVAVTPNAPSNDNTLLYVGIGAVAILGVVGAAILMMRRRK